MKVALGVRKGAWTSEEDDLLRNCVELQGEGRWNLVPSRAGLNRCRKSCRLRWLNYLKPSIKRGEFEEDEIDMIVRLHNLLGNKWSLIAGRIPGRTGNDIKNYWNTRLARKNAEPNHQAIRKVEVIKPHLRTFSRGATWLSGKATLITCPALGIDNINNNNDDLADKAVSLPPVTEAAWWEGLLDDMDIFDQVPTFANLMEETSVGELLPGMLTTADKSRVQGDKWDDSSFDIDLSQLQ